MKSVGVLERLLFENAFANAIYVGRDEWDRDPYVLPLRDSDGTIQRDIEGQARAQNLTTEQYITQNRSKLEREIAGGKWEGELYIDPNTGEIKEGYLNRDGSDLTLHTLTENRGTMALVASLFTGGWGDSDYNRYNMPIKEREVAKPQVSRKEAEEYILAAFEAPDAAGAAPTMTVDEIASLIKQDYGTGASGTTRPRSCRWRPRQPRWPSTVGRLRCRCTTRTAASTSPPKVPVLCSRD